jgi:hypothetical protein
VLTALDCSASWPHVPIHPSLLDDTEIYDPRVVSELADVVTALAAAAASLRRC